MRHLLVIVVVCAVIGEGWAQNRGSARYVPSEEDDADVTRAPRLTPTRGAAFRRQRPAKAEEPTTVEELKDIQPPVTPTRTTGRRVPQRGSFQHIAPPPPPPLPVQESAPRYPLTAEELPEIPPTAPEGRPQGTRRRRPKKRRKPQAVEPTIAEEPGKPLLVVTEEEKTSITELINDDKKRNSEYQSNPQSRHALPNYDTLPSFQPEKAAWENNPSTDDRANPAGPQYFRPQSTTNRLPVGDAELVGNSRRYPESSPVIPNGDSPAPYVPNRPQSSVSNEASYVPVLHPIRVPSEGASRLPSEGYSAIHNKESTRLPADTSVPVIGHGDRSSGPDPNEIIRNTGSKPGHNIIPQPNEPVLPERSHSEVRLPQDEPPLIPKYVSLGFDPEDLTAQNAKTSDEGEELPNTSNRLPNPSEIHYDSVYPEYSDAPTLGSQRVAGRRQETEDPAARNPLPSYSSPRRDTGTKPQVYDNDAAIDRRQSSQYKPPIQRGSSRYKPENSEEPTSARTEEKPPPAPTPRTRGSSRYQPPAEEYAPERSRSSTRTQSEPTVNTPSRSRSSSTSQSTTTRSRGSQRYVPDTNEKPSPASNSRRQPVNPESPQRNTPETAAYVPIDEIIKSQPRSPPHSSRTPNKPSENLKAASEPEEVLPSRNTLRSRPQHEIRDPEPTHYYEESIDDPEVYDTEYQAPRQAPARGRTGERTIASQYQPPQPEYQAPTRGRTDERTVSSQYQPPQPEYQAPTRGRTDERTLSPQYQPPQPEYQAPQTRQQNRQESQYVPPQSPRSRHQTQYEAPQHPRSDTRQASNRQSPSSSRQQGRSRQNPEPSAAPRRPSGGSNFACPEPFGYFADPVQCDKYYECRNGTAEVSLCNDGLAFNEISAPKFLRCDSLRDVDCKSRPELQEPKPSKNCPRRFGLYPHETDCTKFWNCVDGTATEVQCPPGLAFNDERATCDWADLVESACRTEELLGFSCPEPTTHDLLDGVYTNYPHPTNCQLHFTCIKGADGIRRPRMLSCNEGLVYDPTTSSCKRPDDVPGCEDFYGERRPPKKPARQPASREPEEEIVEEPTPRPRRRGSASNRRARN